MEDWDVQTFWLEAIICRCTIGVSRQIGACGGADRKGECRDGLFVGANSVVPVPGAAVIAGKLARRLPPTVRLPGLKAQAAGRQTRKASDGRVSEASITQGLQVLKACRYPRLAEPSLLPAKQRAS